MGLLRPIKARYVQRHEEAGDVTAFAFRPDRPLRHVAGQHGIFLLPGAGVKPFSIASAPEDHDLVIATKLGSGSKYKTALAGLEPGDVVKVRGPMARFTLDGSADEVLLIAQGVGITPFRSMLRHLLHAGVRKDSTLIHVGSAHAFRGETEQLATRALYPVGAEQFQLDVKRAAYELPGATCYLAGGPAFVAEAAALLADSGVAKKQIKRDALRGY
jgi:ferredoxin-NADP reductase